jgi:putative aldouronate transport system permease protein
LEIAKEKVVAKEKRKVPFKQKLKKIREQRYLCLMSLPFVVWLIIFKYIPLWGWTMAFQEYKPGLGFFQQEFIGLKYFQIMFTDAQFYIALRNTLAMSIMGLLVGFTLPIILAILLNELKWKKFQKVVQTVSYLPHFVSWVIVASIVTKMLSLEDGAINQILLAFGWIKEPIPFMARPQYFWWIVTLADLWKEIGWNSIIFLAAITGINPDLYESAAIDGAGKFKRIIHITLPSILPTVMIMLILAVGNIINIGFERQFLLGNTLLTDVSTVLELYILNYGIRSGRFAFGTAVGIFKSFVSIIMVVGANKLSKKITGVNIV